MHAADVPSAESSYTRAPVENVIVECRSPRGAREHGELVSTGPTKSFGGGDGSGPDVNVGTTSTDVEVGVVGAASVLVGAVVISVVAAVGAVVGGVEAVVSVGIVGVAVVVGTVVAEESLDADFVETVPASLPQPAARSVTARSAPPLRTMPRRITCRLMDKGYTTVVVP